MPAPRADLVLSGLSLVVAVVVVAQGGGSHGLLLPRKVRGISHKTFMTEHLGSRFYGVALLEEVLCGESGGLPSSPGEQPGAG